MNKDLTAVVAVVLLALGGLVSQLLHGPGTDVAWQLYAAGEVLRGARLGVEIQEANPPLFIWLALPVAALARLIRGDTWQVFVVVITGLALAATGLFTSLLRAASPGDPRRVFAPLLVVTAILLLPGVEFGQREHLALILTLPYCTLRAARFGPSARPGPVVSAGIGIAAAAGLALKPYFLLAWLLGEGYAVWREGRKAVLHPEVVVVVTALGSYALGVVLLAPAYLQLAPAWRPLYAAYLRQPLLHSMTAGPLDALPLLALLLLLAAKRYGPTGALEDLLGLWGLGFWLGALAQRKGLPYHYMAADGYGLVLLGSLVLGRVPRPERRPSAWMLRSAPALLGLVVISVLVGQAQVITGSEEGSRSSEQRQLLAALRPAARPTAVFVFSSNPASGWPLAYRSGAQWGSRYVSLWILAALYVDYGEPPKTDAGPPPVTFRALGDRTGVERSFHEAVLEDLTRYRPQRLLVLLPDRAAWRSWGGATQLDYLQYFRVDPRFRDILARYDSMGVVGRYALWRRRGSDPVPGPEVVPGDRHQVP